MNTFIIQNSKLLNAYDKREGEKDMILLIWNKRSHIQTTQNFSSKITKNTS